MQQTNCTRSIEQISTWEVFSSKYMSLNDDVISLCIYSEGLLQPMNPRLGALDRILCRIFALAASICAFRDLLFTVVFH